jgi:hypothetical protein
MEKLTATLAHWNTLKATTMANCDSLIDYHSKAIIAERDGLNRLHYIKQLELILRMGLQKKERQTKFYETRIQSVNDRIKIMKFS